MKNLTTGTSVRVLNFASLRQQKQIFKITSVFEWPGPAAISVGPPLAVLHFGSVMFPSQTEHGRPTPAHAPLHTAIYARPNEVALIEHVYACRRLVRLIVDGVCVHQVFTSVGS